MRSTLQKHKAQIEQMSILKPFSFVLEDDDRENLAELYVVDDDIVIIDEELMAGLDKDLDSFLSHLLKEDYPPAPEPHGLFRILTLKHQLHFAHRRRI